MGCCKSKPKLEVSPSRAPPPPKEKPVPKKVEEVEEVAPEEVPVEETLVEETPPPPPPSPPPTPPQEEVPEEKQDTKQNGEHDLSESDNQWHKLGVYHEKNDDNEDGDWVCTVAVPESPASRNIFNTWFGLKPQDMTEDEWKDKVGQHQPVTGSPEEYRKYNRTKVHPNRILQKIAEYMGVKVALSDIAKGGKFDDHRQYIFRAATREQVEAAAHMLEDSFKDGKMHVRLGGNMYGQKFERPWQDDHMVRLEQKNPTLARVVKKRLEDNNAWKVHDRAGFMNRTFHRQTREGKSMSYDRSVSSVASVSNQNSQLTETFHECGDKVMNNKSGLVPINAVPTTGGDYPTSCDRLFVKPTAQHFVPLQQITYNNICRV